MSPSEPRSLVHSSGQAGRDDGRAALAAQGKDFGEKLGPRLRQRDTAKLVDDQELHRLEVALQRQQPSLVAGYRAGPIREVACMTHVRRKFVGVHRSQGCPIVAEAIRRIAQLYPTEAEGRGSPPGQRAAVRQARAKPVFEDL